MLWLTISIHNALITKSGKRQQRKQTSPLKKNIQSIKAKAKAKEKETNKIHKPTVLKEHSHLTPDPKILS
jgi:hypothetical protein